MPANVHRIQFVISGWSLAFLVLSIGFLTSGFWLYTHQPPPQGPPYYVSRTATALRPCFGCLSADGKMKESKEWKLGKALEIPADKPWWFAPAEEHPNPAKIDDVPMLAVHPATDNEKPWFGFDQRKIYFAVLQDLEPRFSIEHPAPPPPPSAPAPAESAIPPTSGQPGGSSPAATPPQ